MCVFDCVSMYISCLSLALHITEEGYHKYILPYRIS